MRSGFSLVELSIVLVVLGLLTGGILAGTSLIKAAKIHKTISTVESYQTAISTFRDKYGDLPGDMAEATEFWGNADTGAFGGECSNPRGDVGAGTQTCNGNIDGRVGAAFAMGNMAGNHFQNYEMFRIWEHLANAGLIEGEYSGITTGTGTNILTNETNAPPCALYQGCTIAFGSNSGNASPSWNTRFFQNEAPYGHSFYLGSHVGSGNQGGIFRWGSISQQELFSFDSKIDDKQPHTGKIITYRQAASQCGITSPDNLNASYNLQDTDGECTIWWRTGY